MSKTNPRTDAQQEFERLQAKRSKLCEQRDKIDNEIRYVEAMIKGFDAAMSYFLGGGGAEHASSQSEAPKERKVRLTTKRSRTPDPARNSGWAATLRVLEDAPEEGMHVRTVFQRLQESGWDIKEATVRSNLSIATSEGVLERPSSGHYRLMREAEQKQDDSSQKDEAPTSAGAPPSDQFQELIN